MPERFLGIDTSNYRTSAAVYDAESGAWRNEGGLLTVPEGAIGLRQSDALFFHVKGLPELAGRRGKKPLFPNTGNSIRSAFTSLFLLP